MQLNRFLFRLLPLLLLLLTGCKKDDADTHLYYEYFPLDAGHYVTYAVREIDIDDQLNVNDTAYYYIKAEIGDTITDNEGRIARRYNRYYTDSLNHPWNLHDIWTSIIEGGRAELVEENQRTIKLVFAPTKYKQWNCNAYSTLDSRDCYYRDIHKPLTVNGIAFDSTLTVEQKDFHSLIDYRREYEQYAAGVGMIYKQVTDFQIQNADMNDVVKGTEIILKVVDYGVE